MGVPSTQRPVTAWLGLGANLGEREAAIREALESLDRVPGVAVRNVSRLRETEPVGGPPQGPYLNGVAEVETTLPPATLLGVCKQLERNAGRDFDAPRNAPRPLDLDLLLYGDHRIDTKDLVVPHPRMAARAFVLEPLAELGVDVAEIAFPSAPEIVESPETLRARCRAWVAGGCSVGLVPTMGALHAGHLSLVERARRECDRVVVTIFVNPLQFGPGEDFAAYPRAVDDDVAALREAGVDVVFAPTEGAMFAAGFCSHIAVGAEAESMEGAFRDGHFAGVATVVAILWSIAQPDRAYFGQKDAQQVAVIRRMHEDLKLSGTLVECDIVREPDGLAMSSRNAYLGPDERRAAATLSRAIAVAQQVFSGGERDASVIVAAARAELEAEPLCHVDYVELRRDDDLGPLLDGAIEDARLLIAACVGVARLIDNASLSRPHETGA